MKGSDPSTWWSSNDCPSGKRAYVNRRAAKRANSRLVRMGHDRLSVYKCTQCLGFHLGHLPQIVRDGQLARADIYRPGADDE